MKNVCNQRVFRLDANGDGAFSYSDIPNLLVESYKLVGKYLTTLLSDTFIGKFFEIQTSSCDSLLIIAISGLVIFTCILLILFLIQFSLEVIKKRLFLMLYGKRNVVPINGPKRLLYKWVISKSALLSFNRLIFFGVLFLGGFVAISSPKMTSIMKGQSIGQLKKSNNSEIKDIGSSDRASDLKSGANRLVYENIYLENKSSLSSLDSRVRSITPEQARTFKSLSRALTEGLSTDLEKTYVIYKWVTENIAYDTDAFFSRNLNAAADPLNVLRTRKGICDGYSKLIVNLGRDAGLKVNKVNGYAKGYGYSPGVPVKGSNHSWNIVQINGKPFLLDSTWDSGGVSYDTREFSRNTSGRYEYFLADPSKLIASHFPTNPADQLLQQPVSREQFARSARPD